jgi:WD40 repeat protein
VIAGTNSGHVLIWKLNLNDKNNQIKLVSMSKPHSEMVLRILVSPDESFVSTISKEGISKIWSLPDKKSIETLISFTSNCLQNRENIKSLT